MIYAIGGAFVISLAPVMVLLIPLNALEIAFLRTGLGGLFLLFFSLIFSSFSFKELFSHKKSLMMMIFSGCIFAVDMYFWNLSVLMVGAGLATVLANSQVFYMSLWGRFKKEEELNFSKLFSIACGFLGICMIFFFSSNNELTNEDYKNGILLGLAAGIAYAIYIISLRGSVRLREQSDLTAPLIVTSLSCSISLMLYGLVTEQSFLSELTGLNFLSWFYIVFFAIGVHIGGWYLISKSFSSLAPSSVGMCLLLQPLLASIWGSVFFKESFSYFQVFGIFLTLFGLFFLQFTYYSTRKRQAEVSTKARSY